MLVHPVRPVQTMPHRVVALLHALAMLVICRVALVLHFLVKSVLQTRMPLLEPPLAHPVQQTARQMLAFSHVYAMGDMVSLDLALLYHVNDALRTITLLQGISLIAF